MVFTDTLSIDIETFSSNDLPKCGLYKYVEAEDFEILLFSYKYKGKRTRCIDLAQGEEIPQRVLDDLVNPAVLKKAFNAPFEIVCLRAYLGIILKYNQWECTMVRSAMCGLPMSLDKSAEVLRVENQKDKGGTALINYFSKPCKATKANGGRTRNLPKHDLVKWQQYKDYNIIDVDAESDVSDALSFYNIPVTEHNYWILDQLMADRGICVDQKFIHNALAMDATYRGRLLKEALDLAGIQNANSAAQIKDWLSAEMDEKITTLKKAVIPELLARAKNPTIKKIIEIRQNLAKSSVAKYHTMLRYLCADGRLHGIILYYGASRTGRAAGRGLQPHNLPRGDFKDPFKPRKLVAYRDIDFMQMCYGPTPNVLSSLIRTAFMAGPGKTLLVADYSAIEACVLAWLAGEQWRLDVFFKGGDIYSVSAAKAFKLLLANITDDLRQQGKVLELACGYGGGVNAVTQMDNKKVIPDDEKQPLVDAWRKESPAIKQYWKDIENAAKQAIVKGERTRVRNILFDYRRGSLFITLPSGRKLTYAGASVKPGKEWGTRIVYKGMQQTSGKWIELDTYGGKLVENIVQAVARDILYNGLMNLHKEGFKTVLHVHDEAAAEGNAEDLPYMKEVFSRLPVWARGLPLSAKVFESKYYKK